MFYSTNTLVFFWPFSLLHLFLIIPTGDHDKKSSDPKVLPQPYLTNRLDFSGDREVLASNAALKHSQIFFMGMQKSTDFTEENLGTSKKTKKTIKPNLCIYTLMQKCHSQDFIPKSYLRKIKKLHTQYCYNTVYNWKILK